MPVAKSFDYQTFSPWKRLKEIGMFFQKNDPVHQALRRLARRLDKAGIPYAVMGAMAVNFHGARRTTDDVDVLLTPKGLDQFRSVVAPNSISRSKGGRAASRNARAASRSMSW
jgi:hypothetical protein